MNDSFTKFARGMAWAIIWLWFIATLDLIDFHVCLKDAGHCKIVDPTKVDIVPKPGATP